MNNRWFLVFTGFFVAIPGIIFTALMWRSAMRAFEMDQWTETPCFIEKSQVKSRNFGQLSPEFSFDLQYQFQWENEKRTSKQLELRGRKWTKDIAKVNKLIDKYPARTTQTCYVNPSDSSISVLKKDSKAPLYSIWFPILFIVGGLGMSLKALLNSTASKKADC